MARYYGITFRALACFSVGSILAGCTNPDTRLIADEASCRSMGHASNTPLYQECLKDLNDRRCALGARKGWTPKLVATAECTRVN